MNAPASTEEAKAGASLRHGSGAAIAATLLALGAPAVLLALVARGYRPFSLGNTALLQLEGLLVVLGAVLLFLALFLYRRAFSHLKHTDRRLVPAATLCLVGSLGALAIVIAGAYLSGGASGISSCLGGHASEALSCLRSRDPAVGYLALAGFWLVWLGAVGLAVGLVLSGRHFRSATITAGGVLYALLVLDLLAPFTALVVVTSLTRLLATYALLGAPLLALIAAGCVYAGARTASAPAP
jgi:hypothetical protein